MEKSYLVITEDEGNGFGQNEKFILNFEESIIFLKKFINTYWDNPETEIKEKFFQYINNCQTLKELDDYPDLIGDNLVGAYKRFKNVDGGMFVFQALDELQTLRIIKL